MNKRCICCGGEGFQKLTSHKEFEGHSIFQCENCGFIFTHPFLDPDFLKEWYKEEYRFQRGDEKVTESFIVFQIDRARTQFAYIQDRMGKKGQRILGIGCGIGALLNVFKKYDYKVVGIEPDGRLASYGKDKYGIEIKVGVFEDFEFTKNYFDGVLMSHVFEHFCNPIDCLQKIKKVIKKDGFVFLELPNDDNQTYFKKTPYTGGHCFFYNKTTFSNIAEKAGFIVKDVTYCGESLKECNRKYANALTQLHYKLMKNRDRIESNKWLRLIKVLVKPIYKFVFRLRDAYLASRARIDSTDGGKSSMRIIIIPD